MKYISLLLVLFSSQIILSQRVSINRAKDYKDTIRIETLIPTFLFICPTDFLNTDSIYNSKLNSLIKSDKRNKSANIIVSFYKPLMAANKTHSLYINGLDSIIELKGKLQCFALNFSCDRIDSTLKRTNLKTKYWYNNLSLNTTEIVIYDNMCPQNLGERLHYYNNFMEELILPYYSEKEEIKFLKQRIFNLENRITNMEKLMKNTNDSLLFNSQNSQPKSVEKPNNNYKKPRK